MCHFSVHDIENKKIWSFSMFYLLAMSNQELVNAGMKTMDETDQAIERTKKVSQYIGETWSWYFS